MTTKKRNPLVILLFLLIVCVALVADSNLRLVTTEYTVSSALLPETFDGFRIVQLSDLHTMEFGKHNSRLVKKVSGLNPDLIVLTGDFIEAPEDIPMMEALIPRLTELAPVYFVSGNHDWASKAIVPLRQAVTDCGATYLSNSATFFEKDGQRILIVGVEDPNSIADMISPEELLTALAEKFPDEYTLLLAHRNTFVRDVPDLPCDLIFTGHGHGGVLRLPFVGGVFDTERNLFPAYDAGIFHSGRYDMVVSRGLGGAPDMPRLFNNPEIVAVTLHQK